MPEGDTVFRTARRLHQAFAGEVLDVVDLRWGELDGRGLAGRSSVEVRARGKHILHRIEGDWTLHSHLRMEGRWHVEATPSRGASRRDVRALLATSAWTGLGLRLGMLDLVPTSQEDRLVGHLGPDILGPDWDFERAMGHVMSSPVSIGEALLDQRNLAGIGTLYCSESLFLERVHPWASPSYLGEAVVEKVIRRAHRLLHANVEHAVQSTTGSRRRGETSYVHARSGRPCRRCGDMVRVAMIGQAPQDRTMFSCPTCQGGLGPTDDGRPQRPLGTTGRSSTSRYRPSR
ncbi:MAG: DNA-formamidopyrimidine glycosylase family protein [Mobilicoccus sp.]|nr:DNA-formamidopyrimidine glycosylase family protein [Mobilicoccus sp.]